MAALLFLASSSAGPGRADSSPACTHGLSSVGPIILRNGEVVGGSTTPHTEACLP